MKPLLWILPLSALLLLAQDPASKAKEPGKVRGAVDKVGQALEKAKDKTVDTTKDVAGKTADVSKTAAGKTADASKTAAGKTAEVSKTAAGKTADASKTAAGKTVSGAKATAGGAKTVAGKTADGAEVAGRTAAGATGGGLEKAGKTVKSVGMLDINTASEKELEGLPGIGDAYAAKIIAARPYQRKDELVAKGVIPESTYEKIKNRVVARQKK
ncbi:MAG: helix-hairpin-helix domain-containing protein [Bryobacteraceae bacterium]